MTTYQVEEVIKPTKSDEEKTITITKEVPQVRKTSIRDLKREIEMCDNEIQNLITRKNELIDQIIEIQNNTDLEITEIPKKEVAEDIINPIGK